MLSAAFQRVFRGSRPPRGTAERRGAISNAGLDPGYIGEIVAAALVILHIEHNRTT